jgi:hypothetical protein
VSTWTAWLIIGALFAVPGAVLWRWRHEPSKPQARQDMEDAYRKLQERRGSGATQYELDRWRANGRTW